MLFQNSMGVGGLKGSSTQTDPSPSPRGHTETF